MDIKIIIKIKIVYKIYNLSVIKNITEVFDINQNIYYEKLYVFNKKYIKILNF